MGETEEFNPLTFEKRLAQLKDTQECIQSLSAWCLKQRDNHKKIVQSWLNVLKRVKVEQRLVLFYLANDVIQYSKRKNYEFVESWGLNLQKATPLVRDEKVRPKILRIFKIWEQRAVYDEEFLSDLTGLLSAGAAKKTDDDPLDFQPQQLVNKIKQCSVLEADTDLRLKYIHESPLELSDTDALYASLKDRRNKEDVEKDLNEGISCVEKYTQALQREIVAREALLALLTSANQYYSTQRGEVKVVAYAYKNFGARVRALKRKLDELIPTLPGAAPSPPQRDEDVPSPGPDEDIDLPNSSDLGDEVGYNIDKTFNTSMGADGSLYNLGLSSFLNSEIPLELFNDNQDQSSSANKIEVINSRPNNENQEFNINDFLNTLLPNDNSRATDNISVGSSQKSQDALPGLDLLTPESTGNPPPPTSFYGTMESITDEPSPQQYNQETNSTWSNTNWNVAPAGVVPVYADTPESPPPAPLPPPPLIPKVYTPDVPALDVDHRGILPPPPPPPVLPVLGHLEDVDHRLLPTVPPPLPVPTPNIRQPIQQDVDHRNLISLTQAPRPVLPVPRPVLPPTLDQDYRVPTMAPQMAPPMAAPMAPPMAPPMVPPMVPPPDIVESVDMDLSEDEDQQGMYSNQNEHGRRQSFNNKVLVGGDNGKTKHANLIRINSVPDDKFNRDKIDGPQSAPLLPPMPNPFDNMPENLRQFNSPPKFINKLDPRERQSETGQKENPVSNDNAYEEDLRSRGLDPMHQGIRNPSPPDFENFPMESDWQNPNQRPLMGPRFPRNWAPRTNFRPHGQSPPFWPRNGPRPNRWLGPPRPQRFW